MNNTRKAAILIASLDRRTADALLDQMQPAEADLIRRIAMSMEDIDPVEQEAVIGEFLGGGRPRGSAGVELELSESRAAPPEPVRSGPAFGFLRSTDCQQLAPLLRGEHPQTIAVVVSHLPPERSLEVLASLPPSVQADCMRRLVDLDETDPEIIRELERGLESRISQHVRMERRRAAGLSAVVNILQAADRRLERQLLVNLSRHAPHLARQLPCTAPALTFEDLMHADGPTLATLMQACEPQVAMLALAGTRIEFVERVLAQLPAAEARRLRVAWQNLPPTPLSDVEAAQQELVRLAEQLDAEGHLDLALSIRTSVA